MTTTQPDLMGLQVGAASRDITPSVPVRMQGYNLRCAEAITDRLLVSALAVGSHRAKWLLLSVDCIGVDRCFTSRVRKNLSQSLSLPASAITIACSHTHSGPATLPRLGEVEADAAYLDVLERECSLVAEMASHTVEDVLVRLGTTELRENVNRREWKNGKIELGADPRGPVDNRLRVIRFDRAADGSPLALIVHYACHSTTSSDVPRISGDWPGVMRTTLQAVYGADQPPVICFLQGCAGDVTHRIARERAAWPGHFGRHTAVQAGILGRVTAAAAMTACERSVTIRADQIETVLQPLSLRYHQHAGSEQTEAQVVRIGPNVTGGEGPEQSIWIVALPGEPFAIYSTGLGDRLCRELGARPENVLVCGYANDAVGYLCTPRALVDGGYETAQAHHMYHRPAAFSLATQALVFDRISEAAIHLLDKRPRPGRSAVGLTLKRLGRFLAARS